jgi:RNA polymerase sigma factor
MLLQMDNNTGWDNGELDALAVAAAADEREFESLLTKFRPFLWGKVSKLAGSSYDTREELMSAAMRAFHEAVKTYDRHKGHFFMFMDRVIRSRLIDCLRRLNANKFETVPLEEQYGEESVTSTQLARVSVKAHAEDERRRDLISEIEAFKQKIGEWSISLELLAEHSPKQERTRAVYNEICELVYADAEIMRVIFEKKYYPVKKISKISKLPPKIVERARIFTIGALLIRTGDFQQLNGYIKTAQA